MSAITMSAITLCARLLDLFWQANVLKFHVLGNKVLRQDMRNGTVSTLDAGSRLFLTVDDSGVRVRDGGVNTARVTQADMLASNGILHEIDEVLVPAYVQGMLLQGYVNTPTGPAPVSLVDLVSLTQSMPRFSTLASLLSAAGLVDALSGGSLTMFAPTNNAFGNLPEALMDFLIRPVNKQLLVWPTSCTLRSMRMKTILQATD